MALFFFNFSDGKSLSDDDVGLELPSAEDAYLEAVAAAKSMWSELLTSRVNPTRCAFDVTDEGGRTVHRVEFQELLENCRPAERTDLPSSGLMRSLEETHERASTARADMALSLAQVRHSLAEAHQLLSKLETFEHQQHRYR